MANISPPDRWPRWIGTSYTPPRRPPDWLHSHRPAREVVKDPSVHQRVGLFMGRFLPPHLGHQFLVEEAYERCGMLAVVVPLAPKIDGSDVLRERQSGMLAGRLLDPREEPEECDRLTHIAHRDAQALLERDPALASPRGRAALALLTLFGHDPTLAKLDAG
jgi:cytidyltransferase-like protein